VALLCVGPEMILLSVSAQAFSKARVGCVVSMW